MADAAFTNPGVWHKWPVPKNVKNVDVTLVGAGSSPSRGGQVSGKLAVNENQTLYIWIGEAGRVATGTTGRTANGNANVGRGGHGGNGTTRGGSAGGGATILRINNHDGPLKAVAGGAAGRSGDYAAEGGPVGGVNPAYAELIMDDTPLAYYQFDEASGDFLDTSGNARHGQWTGSKTQAAAPVVTDGGTSVDMEGGYGNVADAAWMRPNHLTVEAWFSPDSVTSDRPIVTRTDWNLPNSGTGRAFHLMVGNGQLIGQIVTNTGNAELKSPVGSIVIGSSYHAAMTYDGGTMRLYLNGVEVANWFIGGISSVVNPAVGVPLGIGTDSLRRLARFLGRIDHVAYYSTVLSAATITTHFNAGVDATPPDPPDTGDRDWGTGGHGGPSTGEAGTPGLSGTDTVGNATGGTPLQAGNGGTSSVSNTLNGENGVSGTLSPAGKGGTGRYGGGGGGGGYRSGGGGQAASNDGRTPGGGGGGGSNYTGGLTGAQSVRGGGDTGDGRVRIEWNPPGAQNQPPNNPTDVKIDGKPKSDAMPTKQRNSVKVQATLDDPDGHKVRMEVEYSRNSNMSGSKRAQSPYVQPKDLSADKPKNDDSGKAELTLQNLSQDTRYYLRIWAEDSQGKRSLHYTAANFWMNRSPTGPTLQTPAENTSWPSTSSIQFTWSHNDPDPNDGQSAFQLEYRPAADTANTTKVPSEGWYDTSTRMWVADPNLFRANSFYEWRVRTKDQQSLAGAWSSWNSFYASGVATPPKLGEPNKGMAVGVDEPVTFYWTFKDPSPGDSQTKADLRYRAIEVGQGAEDDWITVPGDLDPNPPGTNWFWTFPNNTFRSQVTYEWQVRTYDTAANVSQWSYSETFTVPNVGTWIEPPVLTSDTVLLGTLGCGTYRVFVYTQGGEQVLGELTPVNALAFDRIRDEISRCNVVVSGFGPDCGDLLREVRSWAHEIVLFRDGVRVWEGPITRITYTVDGVAIEAKDVMAYLYRRIMRQGYNDSYRIENNQEYGFVSVVKRARQIAMNALAYQDPNVLPYLTMIEFPDDATQGRIVLDYSKTAWEEIDDLAATAGLDYTVIGRRIMFWDTHRSIGRLPELRDGDFSDPPIVSEYGMQLANFYAVTNNSGVWGEARPTHEVGQGQYYGPIELLASAWGETDSKVTMDRQAKNNIEGRWPTPLVVRVPDNSTLNPNVNVPFNHLVPGVWIPLRATRTLRQVTQWQKLDSVTVEVVAGAEQVKVIMSPAPGLGSDPDADAAAIEAAE